MTRSGHLKSHYPSSAVRPGIELLPVSQEKADESEAVSRNYTHIETETKRAALDKLPDVTAPANTLKRS